MPAIQPAIDPTNDRRVVVGLSGGVDSAVTAALLAEQGYTVHGIVLDTWHATPPLTNPLAAAAAVAAHLDIPLVQRDVRQDFYTRVVEPFLNTYAEGRTPNPCVLCNPAIKLATLLDEADRIGASWVATGHYARVVRSTDMLHTTGGPAHLLQARASAKDQSYALYRLGQHQLSRLLLPLGDVESKAQVRDIARGLGLPAAETGESQDLCFVAAGHHADLLAKLRPNALRPGPILDEVGHHLGDHQGLARYTVGQRGGLGIAASTPLYVLSLDPERNTLIVGPRERLARESCCITDVTFTGGTPPAPTTFEAMGRVRYHAPLAPITVTLHTGGEAHVRFSQPQVGIAPGQSLVFYDGEEVLGGGIICGNSEAAAP